MNVKTLLLEINRKPYWIGAGLSAAIAVFGAIFTGNAQNLIYRMFGVYDGDWTYCSLILASLVSGVLFIFFLLIGLSQVGRQQRASTHSLMEIEARSKEGEAATHETNRDIQSRPFLIAGFSPFSRHGGEKYVLPGEEGYEYKQGLELEDAITKDEGSRIFGNWQQPLRVVHRLSQKGRALSHVVLFIGDQGHDLEAGPFLRNPASAGGKDPAVIQAERLIEILQFYFDGQKHRKISFSIARQENGEIFGLSDDVPKRSYNNANYVQRALGSATKHLMREARISERRDFEAQCYIDITAGTSVLSVAAATFSYNREYLIAYIGSGHNCDELHVMDTTIDLGMLHEG